MPLLFEGTAGRVVRLDDPAVTCQAALAKVGPESLSSGEPDARISYQAQKSIVTRLTLSARTNVQFLHTLGSHIYIYVFGDRIGQITLSGLAFTCNCDDKTVGAELMYQWYKVNRVSKRQTPITVTIGSTYFEGFVLDFSEDVIDAQTQLVQWGVSMVTIPEKS